jgi:acetate kinase
MNILTINPGSATVKFAFYKKERKTKSGKIENFKSYKEALVKILKQIDKTEIEAVGFRVVHGGEKFITPAIITNSLLVELEKLSELAPLHNPPALLAIGAAKKLLGDKLPLVAVFDTMFYRKLPKRASTYALPSKLNKKYKIQRLGFHGLAHEYMLKRFIAITKGELEKTNIITLQLGSGCSITAIKNGKAIDTSMGFTPLEGLVMRTRCGDIDPTLVCYLAAKEGKTAKQIIHLLNTQAGLAGLTGTSGDIRILSQNLQREDYRQAIELFVYRIQKYIGAYFIALGEICAIVFGGGVGEGSFLMREKILEGLDCLGLVIDKRKNKETVRKKGVITSKNSKIKAYVVSVDESVLIEKYTREVLNSYKFRTFYSKTSASSASKSRLMLDRSLPILGLQSSLSLIC